MKSPTTGLCFLGWRPTGDLGPLTYYTTKKGRVVAYPRSPPLSPPSARQVLQRSKWQAASLRWQALAQTTRIKWSTAAKRANLRYTGYSLWMRWATTSCEGLRKTITHQTGITLPTA
jgi:hypothetical protein